MRRAAAMLLIVSLLYIYLGLVNWQLLFPLVNAAKHSLSISILSLLGITIPMDDGFVDSLEAEAWTVDAEALDWVFKKKKNQISILIH